MMNKNLYKVVFSKTRNAYIVVSEIASSVSGGVARSSCTSARAASTFGAFSFVVASGLTLSFMLMASAWAAPAVPKGGVVAQGNVAISQRGNVMTVNQSSDKAIVNWQSFSIGTGAAVNIVQPSASSTHLSRVTGNDPSVIQGQFQSNGQVVLVNPNGIVVGKDGSVSANSFTASTLNITDADFMAGKYQYARNGANGEVINQGKIETAAGGYVALLGAKVTNEGTITSQQGAVYLGAGDAVAVPVTGSGRIKFEVSPAAINTSVNNNKDAVIVAEGGQVYMRAASLNDLAVASVQQTGSVDVSGSKSGNVTALADKGQIKATGTIKANSIGTTNGVPNKGGNVIIGRDLETGVLAASTDVRGAKLQAKDGFVETSADYLDTAGIQVQAKTWLLDPVNVEINATNVAVTAGNSVVTTTDINAALNLGTSVVISTGVVAGSSSSATGVSQGTVGTSQGNGDILVNENISKTAGGNTSLTLIANRNINVAAGKTITSTVGALNVVLNSNGNDTGGGIQFGTGAGITSNGGNITLGGGSAQNGTGFAIADGVSTLQGIALYTANINAGGGIVVMNGRSAVTNYQGNLSNISGFFMSGGSISTSGTGTINLTGHNQNTDTQSRGLVISSGTITGGSSAAVTVTGDSRGVTSSTFTDIKGAMINGTVTSTGGDINIIGFGGAGAQYDNGVDVGGSVLAVGSGAINITGTANTGGSGGNVGVLTSGSGTISSVNGAISITGTGGVGNGSQIRNHGVQVSGSNAIRSTGTGNITVTGRALNNDTNFSIGVTVGGGGIITNSGTIKLDGQVPNNYQVAVNIGAALTASTGNVYVRSVNAGITNSAAGIISGNNVSIENTGGTIDANGVITKGSGGATTWSGQVARNGIDLSGSVTAANNLNLYGNQTNTEAGVRISGATTTVTGKNTSIYGNSGSSGKGIHLLTSATLTGENVTVYGNSSTGNGLLLDAATLSGHYINATGATNTGYTGFAWQGGNIRTTGTAGTSSASIIKGTSAASSTASNGFGAFMMFGDGVVSALTGTTITLAGEATTLTTGQNIKERGILVQGGRTLTASGDITLDGSSKSAEGISFGGTINMATVAGLTNTLTIKGTSAASSNASLNALNFSGAINANAATSAINFIGEAKNLSGINIDNTINISGAITGNAANVNVQARYGKIVLDGAISGANISIDNTGGTIDSTGVITAGAGTSSYTNAININKALTATGNVNILGKVANTTNTGINLTATAPITSTGTNKTINIVSNGNVVNAGALKVTGATGTGSTIKLISSSGGISGSGAIGDSTNTNSNITFDQTGTSTYGGAINASLFTKASAGTLALIDTLTATNANIQVGTLKIGDGGASTAGTLDATNVNIAAGTSLIFNRVSASGSASQISGSGALTKEGVGTVTLTGDSSAFTGATTISAGTLEIGNGGASGRLGSGLGIITNNGTLAYNLSSDITVEKTVTGTGALFQRGSGTTTLTANNTYTGTTSISGGILQVGDASSTGTLGFGGDVTLSNNASLNYQRNTSTIIANNISGTGNVSAVLTGTSSELTVNNTIALTDGTINLVTDGDISLKNALSTTNATDAAIILIAGQSVSAGNSSGGNVVASGSGAITLSSPTARATIYTGSTAFNTGLIIPDGNNRYGSDEIDANYTAALGTGQYAIYRERPTVQVAFNNVTKTYDGLAYSGSGGYQQLGLKSSDTNASLTGSLSFVGNAQGAVNVGTYNINGSGLTSTVGYDLSYTAGNLVVNKAPVTLTLTSASTVYGTVAPLTYSVNGLVNNETALTAGVTVSGVQTSGYTSASTTNNIGNYTITASGLSAQNYELSGTNPIIDGTLSITPATLTFAPNAATRYVTRQDPALSFAVSGLVNGDTSSAYTAPTISRAAGELAGTYLISLAGGAASNYTLDKRTNDFTILAAFKVNILMNNASTIYGTLGTASIVNVSYLDSNNDVILNLTKDAGTTWSDGVGGSIQITPGLTGVTASSNVGLYSNAVTASHNGTATSNNNFNDVFVTRANYVVDPKSLTIDADNITRTYDGTSFTGSVTPNGFVLGQDVNTLGGVIYSGNAIGSRNVGSYSYAPIVVNSSGAAASNYSITYTGGTLDTTARLVTISGMTINSKEYDGTRAAIANLSNVVLGNIVSGDNVTLNTPTATFNNANADTGKAVTLNSQSISGADAGNYTLLNNGVGPNLSYLGDITQKAVSISTNSASAVYTGFAQSLGSTSVSGVIAGESITTARTGGSLTNVGTSTTSTTTTAGANTTLTNYAINVVEGTLTVTPAQLRVLAVEDTSRVFNGATQSQGVTLNGVLGNDQITVTGLVSQRDAGNYNSSLSLTGSALGNYTQDLVNASFNIAKANASVNVNSITTTYNGATQSVSGFSTNGVLGGDSIVVVGDMISGRNANTYLSQATASHNNYNLTVNQGSLIINQAPLVVSGLLVRDKVYDATTSATIDTSAMQLNGLIGSDDVQVTITSASFNNANAGINKPVVLASTVSGVDQSNYIVTSQSTVVGRVTPAPLSLSGITAEDKIADGITLATLNFSGASFQGLKGSDQMSVDGLGNFNSPVPGSNKPVQLSLNISSQSLGNYLLTLQELAYASITAASSGNNNGSNGGNTAPGIEISPPPVNGLNVVNPTARMLATLDFPSSSQALLKSSVKDTSAAIAFTILAEASQIKDCVDQASYVQGLTSIYACLCEGASKAQVQTLEPQICYVPATQVSQLRPMP